MIRLWGYGEQWKFLSRVRHLLKPQTLEPPWGVGSSARHHLASVQPICLSFPQCTTLLTQLYIHSYHFLRLLKIILLLKIQKQTKHMVLSTEKILPINSRNAPWNPVRYFCELLCITILSDFEKSFDLKQGNIHGPLGSVGWAYLDSSWTWTPFGCSQISAAVVITTFRLACHHMARCISGSWLWLFDGNTYMPF